MVFRLTVDAMGAASDSGNRLSSGLAFVASVAAGVPVPELVAAYSGLIRDFGFDVVAGGCWWGIGKERRYRFFFNTWPAEWQAYYLEQGFFERDFVVEEARQRITPFTWREMPQELFRSPASREFVQAAAARHGWIDGFIVPIRGPNGFEGIVSLAATSPVELPPADRSVLEAMSRALHERCRVEIGFGSEPIADPPLTAREVECLRWVATGKSDWQTGELLGISGATVHFHVEQAKKKLAVRSRVQAVAILTLHGLI